MNSSTALGTQPIISSCYLPNPKVPTLKILFATHILPFPPDSGGRIGFYNPLKYLSRHHEMILFSLVDGTDQSNVSHMPGFCREVVTYHKGQSGDSRRLLRGAFGRPPGTASKYFFPEAGELLRDTIQRHRPDIVELQHLNMAAYLPYCQGAPVILREHNVEYRVWERFAAVQTTWYRKVFFEMLARRVRRYEADMAQRFDRCITVSEADALDLYSVSPTARVQAIPSGVDAEYFAPDPTVAEKPYSMVMTGSFSWKPKQHNLRVLATEISPNIRKQLPEATLTVVGQGIPADLKRLAEEHGVTLTGAVPDVRPYIREASLVLNYVESGGGIALKVLEALAMRKAILSNSLGCEGIDVQHGRDVFLADGPEAFASAAARLLRDAPLRGRLAQAGYNLVRQKYAWETLAHSFDDLYEELTPKGMATASTSR